MDKTDYDFFIKINEWGDAKKRQIIAKAKEQQVTLSELIQDFDLGNGKIVKQIEFFGDGFIILIYPTDLEARITLWNENGLSYWLSLIDGRIFSGGPIETTEEKISHLSHRELLELCRDPAKVKLLTRDSFDKQITTADYEKIAADLGVENHNWDRLAVGLYCGTNLTQEEIRVYITSRGIYKIDHFKSVDARIRACRNKGIPIPFRRNDKRGNIKN